MTTVYRWSFFMCGCYASSSLRLSAGENFAGNRERKTFITTHNITENKSTKKKTNTSTKAAEIRNLTIHFTSQSIWVREQESNLRQRRTKALCYLYTIPPFWKYTFKEDFADNETQNDRQHRQSHQSDTTWIYPTSSLPCLSYALTNTNNTAACGTNSYRQFPYLILHFQRDRLFIDRLWRRSIKSVIATFARERLHILPPIYAYPYRLVRPCKH